jgi:hypothetical protein
VIAGGVAEGVAGVPGAGCSSTGEVSVCRAHPLVPISIAAAHRGIRIRMADSHRTGARLLSVESAAVERKFPLRAISFRNVNAVSMRQSKTVGCICQAAHTRSQKRCASPRRPRSIRYP